MRRLGRACLAAALAITPACIGTAQTGPARSLLPPSREKVASGVSRRSDEGTPSSSPTVLEPNPSPQPVASTDQPVDLELVLAVDASSSVDPGEWRLQMQGYAAAFRDPRVQAAIVSGPTKRIAVAVLVWADATVPKWNSAWFALAGPADAGSFAAFMAGLDRGTEGGTGIGAGVAAAIRRMDRNGFVAPRQVVDVSGDGRETPAREVVVLMPQARAMAAARGVTVNGIAILNEDPGLAAWYRDRVITGPGSFVVTAADYADFAEAIVRKLLREIEWQERLSMTARP